MSIPLTQETKNSVAMSLVSKDIGLTWGQANFEWGNPGGTFGVSGTPISEETKNNVSLTLESR